MAAMCKICISPYREELMRAWNNHFPRKLLYEKYKPLIWLKGPLTEASFHQAIYKHREHKNPGVVVLQTTGGSVGRDTQGIAKMFTQLMSRKLETMSPEDISVKDYVAVNKLVLEEKKLQLDKNEQMLALAKLFGVPEVDEPILGEETNAELRPPEDEGDKQISP